LDGCGVAIRAAWPVVRGSPSLEREIHAEWLKNCRKNRANDQQQLLFAVVLDSLYSWQNYKTKLLNNG